MCYLLINDPQQENLYRIISDKWPDKDIQFWLYLQAFVEEEHRRFNHVKHLSLKTNSFILWQYNWKIIHHLQLLNINLNYYQINKNIWILQKNHFEHLRILSTGWRSAFKGKHGSSHILFNYELWYVWFCSKNYCCIIIYLNYIPCIFYIFLL